MWTAFTFIVLALPASPAWKTDSATELSPKVPNVVVMGSINANLEGGPDVERRTGPIPESGLASSNAELPTNASAKVARSNAPDPLLEMDGSAADGSSTLYVKPREMPTTPEIRPKAMFPILTGEALVDPSQKGRIESGQVTGHLMEAAEPVVKVRGRGPGSRLRAAREAAMVESNLRMAGSNPSDPGRSRNTLSNSRSGEHSEKGKEAKVGTMSTFEKFRYDARNTSNSNKGLLLCGALFSLAIGLCLAFYFSRLDDKPDASIKGEGRAEKIADAQLKDGELPVKEMLGGSRKPSDQVAAGSSVLDESNGGGEKSEEDGPFPLAVEECK